jgi:hypothetical protein
VSPLLSVGTEMVKGVIGIETMPPAAPDAQLPQTKEDLLRIDSAHAVQNRDLMLANAMQITDPFGPGGAPAILTRDANHDGLVDPPSASNRLQDELGPTVRDGLHRWGHRRAEPGSTGVVTTAPYDGARSTTMSGAWDGRGAPGGSAWRDDGRATDLAYRPGTGPAAAFPPRPTDPRVLDDPRYDRVHNEVREGG